MKTRMNRFIIGIALLVTSQAAFARAGEQPAAGGGPTRKEAVLVSLTAAVTSINLSNREVTLKGPRGNEVTFVVDERVKRLNEVKVGDNVRADYYLALVAELRPPTAEEEKNPIQVIAGAGKAPPGTSPAAGGLRQFKVVTTVEEIDTAAQTITIKGPRGNSLTARAEDPARLALAKKGDHILITYTEALAISVEKAGQ